jgi:hypothetical protein
MRDIKGDPNAMFDVKRQKGRLKKIQNFNQTVQDMSCQLYQPAPKCLLAQG